MTQQETADKNSYVAVPTLAREAAILTDDTEQRNIILTDSSKNATNFLSRIGLLRMNFKVNNEIKSFNGTASVFSIDKSKQKVYAMTCAHNLKYLNPIQNEIISCSDAFFQRRTTIDKEHNKCLQEYTITNHWVHPDYDPSKAICPNDIAVIAFENTDKYFSNLETEMNSLKNEDPNLVHIYGYPVDYRGALCGQSKKANIKQNEKTNLLQYDIQTTGGQSGSPIIKVTQERKIHPYVFGMAVMVIVCFMCVGFSFDFSVVTVLVTFAAIVLGESKLNVEVIPRLKKQVSIVGIHTTGSGTGNIGVKITKETISTIKQQELVKDIKTDSDADDADSFYCLRDTPL